MNKKHEDKKVTLTEVKDLPPPEPVSSQKTMAVADAADHSVGSKVTLDDGIYRVTEHLSKHKIALEPA